LKKLALQTACFFGICTALGKSNPVKLMKLSKTLLAILTTGMLSCGLFSQQAHATAIQGNINFAGSVHLNNNNLALATTVVTWLDSFNNAGKSTVVPGNDGDFAGIPAGTSATMAQPWTFNPSAPCLACGASEVSRSIYLRRRLLVRVTLSLMFWEQEL
jgi:hypothetical protein